MACRKQREAHQLVVEAGLIEILQSVVEVVIPQIDEHADIHQSQVERDYNREQAASDPTLLGKPVRARQNPQISKKRLSLFQHGSLLRSRALGLAGPK
jgi:hypothetical protein